MNELSDKQQEILAGISNSKNDTELVIALQKALTWAQGQMKIRDEALATQAEIIRLQKQQIALLQLK